MIKRLLLGLCVVVCLVSVGVLWFFSTLDLNLHKEKIQQLVFERSGRALSIDGEIEAQFYPWIGLRLHNVTLANAEGFEGASFASVRSSDVQLELLPLFSGTLNVKWVQLHGLNLNLHINEDGVANWEDLLNTTTVVETETSEDDVLQSVEAGAPLAAALSVGQISVTDAHISWVDEKTATDVDVSQLNLTTDAIQLASPVEFTTSFAVTSQSLQANSQVVASGTLSLDLAGNRYSLQNLELETISQHGGLPVDPLNAALSGDVLVNLRAQTFDLTGLRAVIENIPIAGELHGTGLYEAPSFFGEFSSESFSAVPVLRELGAELPADFDEALLSDTQFRLAFQHSEEQILVNGLALKVADIELDGDFQVSNLAQSPVVSGKLASNVFNPAPWSSFIGWQAADPLAMQQASLSAAIRQSGQILSLNELQLTLDDFTLAGNVEVTDVHAVTPPVVFELRGTHLDVDRYLPAANLTETDESLPAEVAVDDSLPLERLKSLDINGSVSFDSVSAAGLTLTDIVIPFVAAEGNLEITEAKAALYGGALFNSASIDLNGDEPFLKWSSNVSAVQSETLLSDYLKSASPISGTAIFNIDMITRGSHRSQWLQAADGAVSLRFTDGAMHGIDIGRQIRRSHALLLGEAFPADDNDVTDFSELSVTGEISGGVLRSEDLSFKAPFLRMTGAGEADLSTRQVDYLATILVTGDVAGQGGADMDALRGLALSVPLQGSLGELSVDFRALLTQALTTDFPRQFEAQKSGLIQQVEEAAEAQQQRTEESLKQKKDAVEVQLEESKEVLIEQVEEFQSDATQKLEAPVNELQKSIEKGVSNLLEK